MTSLITVVVVPLVVIDSPCVAPIGGKVKVDGEFGSPSVSVAAVAMLFVSVRPSFKNAIAGLLWRDRANIASISGHSASTTFCRRNLGL